MEKERICFESTPDIEATIMHLARVRSARKLLETEENILKAQIKAIANDIGCDEFLAERDGQMVTIAYLQNTFPRLDNKRLRIEQEEIYNQYLIQPGAEDRYVCITSKERRESVLKGLRKYLRENNERLNDGANVWVGEAPVVIVSDKK